MKKYKNYNDDLFWKIFLRFSKLIAIKFYSLFFDSFLMHIQFQIFNELLEFESNHACAFHRHHCSRVRLIQLQLGLRKSLVLSGICIRKTTENRVNKSLRFDKSFNIFEWTWRQPEKCALSQDLSENSVSLKANNNGKSVSFVTFSARDPAQNKLT